jgi:hypothetical protein
MPALLSSPSNSSFTSRNLRPSTISTLKSKKILVRHTKTPENPFVRNGSCVLQKEEKRKIIRKTLLS